MSKNITAENIEFIRTVCENNGVHFYDVQVEAIDHIASMVETRWTQFPNEDFVMSFDAVKHDIDWRFFKYKNNKEQTRTPFWQTLVHNKATFRFILAYLAFVMVVASTSFGKENYNETLFNINITLRYALVGFYIVTGIWIANKLSEAKFMLSNLYKRKYWRGIILCFGLSFALMINISIFSQFEYNQTVFGIIMSSFYWVISVPIIYHAFIKIIWNAQKKYPKLYSK